MLASGKSVLIFWIVLIIDLFRTPLILKCKKKVSEHVLAYV